MDRCPSHRPRQRTSSMFCVAWKSAVMPPARSDAGVHGWTVGQNKAHSGSTGAKQDAEIPAAGPLAFFGLAGFASAIAGALSGAKGGLDARSLQ